MVRHVVLFRWKDGVTDEDVAEVCAALATMPGQIDAVRAYAFGPDVGVNPANEHQFAVVADFDSPEGFVAYRDHPAHRRLLDEVLTPRLASRTSVQFELPPGD